MDQSMELQQTREVLATLVAMLPEDALREILGDDQQQPRLGDRWPLDQLETCYRRMVRYASEHEDPCVARILPHVTRYKQRLDRAREALVLRGMPMVLTMAPRLADQGVPVDELIHAGNHGLHRAIDRFDPRSKSEFVAFARSWIRRAMLDAIASTRPPLDGANGPFEIDEDEEGLEIDEPSSGNDERPEDSTPALVLRREMAMRIAGFLRRLPSRDAEIVRLRFGIDRVRSHSIGEIERLFCLNRARIREITERAFEYLEADVHRRFATHPGAMA